MQFERDHLIKNSFPELRERCRERLVDFVEVDLRWGITRKEEPHVLPICLDEIEACRPYFIGILGDRYGTIPATLPPEIRQTKYAWLKKHRNRASITELEILYGVLNDPAMEKRAFFYFRDPDRTQRMAKRGGSIYLEDPTPEEIALYGKKKSEKMAVERKRRLAHLKKRILSAEYPCKVFRDPRELGMLVVADLWKSIDGSWGPLSVGDELDRQTIAHDAFARNRSRGYVPLGENYSHLDRHALGAGKPLAITGESGFGKSALLANWVIRFRKMHPEVFVVSHFAGASPDSAVIPALLRRVIGEIRRCYEVVEPIPDSDRSLIDSFPRWLSVASRRGRMILVLDALNQIEEQDNVRKLGWLPDKFPKNVRVLVSALTGPTLEEIEKRGWEVYRLHGMSVAEKKKAIRAYLAPFRKKLEPEEERRLSKSREATNPLYLRGILDELRVYGADHRKIADRLGECLSAGSVTKLYQNILERYERDYDKGHKDRVRDALVYIWASPRGGLYETEILELLGSIKHPMRRWNWSPIYLALRESLVSRAGVLAFFHDYLRSAVEERYLQSAEDKFHAYRRLADYFAEKYARHGGNASYRELSLSAARMGLRQAERPNEVLQAEANNVLAGSLVAAGVGISHDNAAKFREAAFAARRGCEIARKIGRWDLLADGLCHRAATESRFNEDFGNYHLLDEAISLRKTNDDQAGLRDTLFDKARVAMRKERWDLFTGSLKEAKKAYIGSGEKDLLWEAHVHQIMGEFHVLTGRPGTAVRSLGQARSIYSAEKYLQGVCAAEGWIGLAIARKGKIAEGLDLVRKSLAFERDVLGSQEGAAKWLHNVGELFTEIGNPEKALEAFLLSERLRVELGHAELEKTIIKLKDLRNKWPKIYRGGVKEFNPRGSKFGEFASLWGLGPFRKHDHNPVISPSGKGWESHGVYNPAAWTEGGKIFLLYRADELIRKGRKVSRLGLAVSTDGYNFKRHPEPVLEPSLWFEKPGGCEDPRVVRINGVCHITYTGYDGKVARMSMAKAKDADYLHWEKIGEPLLDESQIAKLRNSSNAPPGWFKSGAIYSEAINGNYWMFLGDKNIHAAVSRDLRRWNVVDEPIVSPRDGFFDSFLVEPGTPPELLPEEKRLRSPEGIWLGYNSARKTESGLRYAFGAVLLDPANPTKVLRRTALPLLEPSTHDERHGNEPNVVFGEGLVRFGGKWFLYYGMADERIGVAVAEDLDAGDSTDIPGRKRST